MKNAVRNEKPGPSLFLTWRNDEEARPGVVAVAGHPGAGPANRRDTVSVMAYQDTTCYVLLGMMASAGLNKNDTPLKDLYTNEFVQ